MFGIAGGLFLVTHFQYRDHSFGTTTGNPKRTEAKAREGSGNTSQVCT